MENKKIIKNILLLLIIFFSFFAVLKTPNKTYSIYKEELDTTINLTIVSGEDVLVSFDSRGGSSVPSRYVTPGNAVGTLPIPTKTGSNFAGWYDSNNQRVRHTTIITGTTELHAVWTDIVCRLVNDSNNLHTETCASSGGCNTAGITVGSTITYGTIGDGNPEAGDAYNCDVDYDGVYDSKESDNKTFIERFYFVREKANSGSENSAVMYYSTSFDSNGRDNRTQNASDINSIDYLTALSYLPSSTLWDNPSLIDLDGNGSVSRFLTVEDLESIYGTIVTNNTNYLKPGSKWFWYENTRFQSNSLGRSGIWLEINNNEYIRIHAHSFYINKPDTGSASENMARPVIEIPMSSLEGYYDEDRFTISFNTFEGDANTPESINKYRGEVIGTLPTPTRQNHEFLGWYTDSNYEFVADPTALVSGNITLYAKWEADAGIQVTLELDGGTISGVTSPIILESGDTIDNLPNPVKPGMTFLGWYTDDEFDNEFDPSVPITANMTLYAKWELGNYVARIDNDYYETLAEAIEHVPTTNTKTRVTILKDITLTSTIIIASTKNVELDGQSYTIDSSSCNLFENSGTLDIINGTLIDTYNGPSKPNVGYVILNKSGATLNISKGTITYNNTEASEAKAVQNNGGTVNMTGGRIECNSQASAINVENAGVINVSGGEIVATGTKKAQGIYLANTASANISGDAYISNVSGNDSRAAVDNAGSGTLTITGGTIISVNFYAVNNRSTGVTKIGINDSNGNVIDTTTPVLKGNTYAINRSGGTLYVYDGVYKGKTGASNGTITKPTGVDFVQNGTESSHKVYYLANSSGGPYTVTFDPDNGDSTSQVTNLQLFDTVNTSMPANPTRTNYIFEKWFVYKVVDNEVIYDGEFTSTTPITDNITVKAKWKPGIKTATISPATISIDTNETETIIVTGPADMESYTFSSIDPSVATVDSNGVVQGITSGSTIISITGTDTGDTLAIPVIVSNAAITRTVTFNDGTNVTSIQVENGQKISAQQMPADPIKTGYIFKGWFMEGTVVQITTDFPIYQDMTVVPKWKEDVTAATITPSTITILKGTTQQINISASVSGETFEDVEYSSTNPSIASVSNSGLVTGVAEGTTTITITGKESHVPVSIPVTVNVIYHTVTFDKKDGSQNPTSSISVEHGTKILSQMPNNPSRTGYLFVGWYEKDDLSKQVTSDTQIDDNLEVVAVWKENVQTVTVTPNPIVLIVGSTQQISISATEQGGTFELPIFSSNAPGIITVSSSGLINAVGVGNTTITMTGDESHLTRTINVTVNPLPTHYTVTFDTKGGSTINSETVTAGGTLGSQMPSDPTRTNSVFAGWYNQDYTQSYDENTVINNDMTFYAKWTPSAAAVCEMDGEYYDTIQKAVNAAPNNTQKTINLIKDVTSDISVANSKVINIPDTKNIIFDLHNYSIDYVAGKKVHVMYVDGIAEVRNGTITSNSGATITTGGSAAIQVSGKGTFTMNSGSIEATGDRQAVNNEGGTVYIGGTASFTANTNGQYNNVERAPVQNTSGTMIITGGTITNTLGVAISMGSGTLTIGEADGTIDTTSIVAQGSTYGLWIKSGASVTVNDGMFKGKTKGINETSRTTHPANADYDTDDTEQIGSDTYKLTYLYSTVTPTIYTITLNPGDGSVTPTSVTVNAGEAVDNLPTPTNGTYTFDGWYTQNTGGTLVVEGVTIPTESTTYYARWSSPTTYTITLNPGDGSVTPTSVSVTAGQPVDNLPTPTNGIYTFDGWYTEETGGTLVVEGVTIPTGSTTYYARWSYVSSTQVKTFNTINPAIDYYQAHIASWKNSSSNFPTWSDQNKASNNFALDATENTVMLQNFYDNNCECTTDDVQCKLGGNVQCDKPVGYDIGDDIPLNVYLYDEVNETHEAQPVTYAKATNGVIYNLIPNQAYYWENANDTTMYGVVKYTGTRRILNTGDVRNTRDLGGLPVDTDGDGTNDGYIKYGRLFRGIKLKTSSSVTELTNLGIDSELDLRESEDSNKISRFRRIEAQNYYVNPFTTTNPAHTPDANETNYYNMTRAAVKYAMQEIVANKNLYFHCRIGTDRTGTVAYVLEGLLGVPEEDRVQDYELSFFYGLVRIHRYHDQKPGSSVGTGHERFVYMHDFMPSNTDIYNWYMFGAANQAEQAEDEALITAFRSAMIESY